MRTLVFVMTTAILTIPAMAQDSALQDPNANADDTFRALVEKCDDTDALVLRARIRVAMPRATDEVQKQAEDQIEQAFAKCGEGKLDEAKTLLESTYEVVNASVTERFGEDGSADVQRDSGGDGAAPDAAATGDDAAGDGETKPWWQFW